MSENDGFDDIIKNLPDEPNEGAKLDHIWDAVEVMWPQFYEGMLIKGLMIVEAIDNDGDRCLRFIASPDMMPWEMVGMLDSATQDARNMGTYIILGGEDDDEEDE
jgi:hypothetical protein